MAGLNPKLTTAVEAYFEDLRRIRVSGGGTGERSYYPPLTNLLNAVGAWLKPKVFCISELTQQGKRREGQAPERGVVEVKPTSEGRLADGGEQAGASPTYIRRYPDPPSPIGN